MVATARILYRGTSGSDRRIVGGIAEGALFVTPDREVAMLYGDDVEEMTLDPNARILKEGSAEFSRITGRRRGDLIRSLRPGETLKSACDDVAETARRAGYHGVEFTSMRDLGIAIFDDSCLHRPQRPRPAAHRDARLTGRKIVLYHGSASFDDIVRDGLVFDRNRTNDFGTGDNLASCGGTYFSDCLSVAGRYADNATSSEASIGGDPCVFAVEIDEGLLVADEDKVWDAVASVVERVSGEQIEEMEPHESQEWTDALLSQHGPDLIGGLRSDLDLDPAITDEDVEEGLRGFLLRSQCWYDWMSLGEESERALAGIDVLCSAARGPLDGAWLHRKYDGFYALTARVLDPIPASAPEGAPVRIVGHVVLRMSNDGLEVLSVECSGFLSVEDGEEFLRGFQESAELRGVEIVAGESLWEERFAAAQL